MAEYPYTKATVNLTKLKLEIADSSITKEHTYSKWDAPDQLVIYFAEALTSEEETTLNGIVSSHDGAAPTWYSLFCDKCGDYTGQYSLTTPTTCSVCGSTDVSDKIRIRSFHDGFYARKHNDQWATDGVNNAGDFNAVAPTSDSNGQSRIRTNAVVGSVYERHFGDIFEWDSDKDVMMEWVFTPRGVVGADYQIELGLIDALETSYIRFLCNYSADTSWHAQSARAGGGSMDEDTGIAVVSGTGVKVKLIISDNTVTTGLKMYINNALVATTDAVNEIPAGGTMMQPYYKLTSALGGGGVRTEIDTDDIYIDQDE